MKKLFLAFFVICFLFLGMGSGSAYVIDDTTLVKAYYKTNPYNSDPFGNWVDIVGEPEVYNIFGIDVTFSHTNLIFEIFTNFPQSGDPDVSWVTPADLFFSVDGDDSNYEYGVAFTGNESMTAGGLYQVSTLKTSYDYFYDKQGWVYGGKYGNMGDSWATAPIPPVAITGGNLLSIGSVTWNDVGTDPNFRIDVPISLSYLDDIVSLDVIYSGSTCANDVITGTAPVPEPATMFLLGTGLLALAGLRRKVIKQ